MGQEEKIGWLFIRSNDGSLYYIADEELEQFRIVGAGQAGQQELAVISYALDDLPDLVNLRNAIRIKIEPPVPETRGEGAGTTEQAIIKPLRLLNGKDAGPAMRRLALAIAESSGYPRRSDP